MIEQVSTFSGRLEEALSIREMTPVELSKRTGLSESTVSQYRSGYAKPKQDKLVLISNALHVNPVWLMGLNVPMNEPAADDQPSSLELTDIEIQIIETYRRMSPELKAALYGFMGIKGAVCECGEVSRCT